jgi:hypothetical protein
MRKKIIIGGVLITAVVVFVLFHAYHSNSPSNSDQSTSLNSTNATTPPTFLGTGALKNLGVTSGQLTNFEQALEQYIDSQNKNVSQVSFEAVRVASINNNAPSPIWTYGFVIQLNNKSSYSAKLVTFNLDGIRLYLYDLGGSRLLYDSQDIGGSPNAI